MRHFRWIYWTLRLVIVTFLFSFTSAWAQDDPKNVDLAWQDAISGQIDAFQRGDGDGALSFAGIAFQERYRGLDGSAFVEDIKRSGYAPVVESFSHSFGNYRLVDGDIVLQVVNFQGPNQGLYQALYQLAEEPDGWRIQSVQLRREPGIGV